MPQEDWTRYLISRSTYTELQIDVKGQKNLSLIIILKSWLSVEKTCHIRLVSAATSYNKKSTINQIYAKLSKRGQSAKQKTKFLDFAYAEWSQTYLKLVQGERKSKLVCNFSEPPPNLGNAKVKQMSAEYQMKLVPIWFMPSAAKLI